MTCESNPAETEALHACCARCAEVDGARWAMLGRLKVGQAAALPLTEETGGEMRLFTIAPRLTPHVRHREKYVDVPVSAHQAFVFNGNSHPAHRIHTLREFVFELEKAPPRLLEGYIVRGDFSRWIRDVFGDHALASELRALEERYQAGSRGETLSEMAGAVRGRSRPRGRRTRDGRPLTSLPYRATKKKTGICKAGTSFIMFSFDTSDHIASREKRKPPAEWRALTV